MVRVWCLRGGDVWLDWWWVWDGFADFSEGVGVIARLERDRKAGFVENDGGADGRTEFARVHSVFEHGVVAEGAASLALCGR